MKKKRLTNVLKLIVINHPTKEEVTKKIEQISKLLSQQI